MKTGNAFRDLVTAGNKSIFKKTIGFVWIERQVDISIMDLHKDWKIGRALDIKWHAIASGDLPRYPWEQAVLLPPTAEKLKVHSGGIRQTLNHPIMKLNKT